MLLTDKRGRELVLQDYDARTSAGVQISSDGIRLWVCVDGVCVLRVRSPLIEWTVPNKEDGTVRYEVFGSSEHDLILRDIGPWDTHKTITNAAEEVVRQVGHLLNGRRLLYYDSEGVLGELLVDADGKFAGFADVN